MSKYGIPIRFHLSWSLLLTTTVAENNYMHLLNIPLAQESNFDLYPGSTFLGYFYRFFLVS